jgi:putative addiction module CopG family antidote
MQLSKRFHITLPNDMADFIKDKIANGEYATESDVIDEGLRALEAREQSLNNWLHHEVGAAYDALKADPTRAISINQLRETLASENKNKK